MYNVRMNIVTKRCLCSTLIVVCFVLSVVLLCFSLKMVSWRPGRYVKTFLEVTAPSQLNMSPWRVMATPFVPQVMHLLCSW